MIFFFKLPFSSFLVIFVFHLGKHRQPCLDWMNRPQRGPKKLPVGPIPVTRQVGHETC